MDDSTLTVEEVTARKRIFDELWKLITAAARHTALRGVHDGGRAEMVVGIKVQNFLEENREKVLADLVQ